MTYAKTLAAALAAVLAAVMPALYTDDGFGLTNWVNVVILACGAIQVFSAPNVAGWDFAKLVASVVSAAAVVLSSALADGVSAAEWIQICVAALGAFCVYRVPNKQLPGKHEKPEPVTDADPRTH